MHQSVGWESQRSHDRKLRNYAFISAFYDKYSIKTNGFLPKNMFIFLYSNGLMANFVFRSFEISCLNDKTEEKTDSIFGANNLGDTNSLMTDQI